MRASLVFAALASAASLLSAAPASAAPPAPVQNVHITSTADRDGEVIATISWTPPADADGARACAQQGVQPATDPTACDVYFDADTANTTLDLVGGKTYTFSVFAYAGAGTAREFSAPATTRPWHGSKVRLTLCDFPTYGVPCRIDAVLTDTRLDSRLQGARVELWRGVPELNPDWRLFDADRTDGDGDAHVRVTPREEHYFQWRFQGVEGVLASTSAKAKVTPRIRVTAHLTHSNASPGERVKIYGIVRPKLDALRIDLIEYQTTPCRSWQFTGQRVTAKRQRLPNGNTTFGYVMTISRSTLGTYRFEVATGSHRGFTYGMSDRVTLTIGSGARGSSRSAPGVPAC